MWFFKNKWKSKLSVQVAKIITQDIEIELRELTKVVGAITPPDVVHELIPYIIAGDITCHYELYDASGEFVKKCLSIFEEPDCFSSDWRVVYSKS